MGDKSELQALQEQLDALSSSARARGRAAEKGAGAPGAGVVVDADFVGGHLNQPRITGQGLEESDRGRGGGYPGAKTNGASVVSPASEGRFSGLQDELHNLRRLGDHLRAGRSGPDDEPWEQQRSPLQLKKEELDRRLKQLRSHMVKYQSPNKSAEKASTFTPADPSQPPAASADKPPETWMSAVFSGLGGWSEPVASSSSHEAPLPPAPPRQSIKQPSTPPAAVSPVEPPSPEPAPVQGAGVRGTPPPDKAALQEELARLKSKLSQGQEQPKAAPAQHGQEARGKPPGTEDFSMIEPAAAEPKGGAGAQKVKGGDATRAPQGRPQAAQKDSKGDQGGISGGKGGGEGDVADALGPCVLGPFDLWRMTRSAVSTRRKRFLEQGFDLDLSYITPRIIAMAAPSQSVTTWAVRNHLSEVEEFFRRKHAPGTVKLWHVSAEGGIDPDTVQRLAAVGVETVQDFGFSDRGVPPLESLEATVEGMLEWMIDKSQSCCVSCRSGKGRTGLVVCCLLLANYAFSPDAAEDAMETFSANRVMEGAAMTVPSQRRWVHYFAQRNSPLRRGPVSLAKVSFSVGAFGLLPGQGNWFGQNLKFLDPVVRCKVLVFAMVQDGGKWEAKKVFTSKLLKAGEDDQYTTDVAEKGGRPLVLEGAFQVMVSKALDNGELFEGPSCWLHAHHVAEDTVIAGDDCDYPRSFRQSLIGARGGEQEAAWGLSITLSPMGARTGLPQV